MKPVFCSQNGSIFNSCGPYSEHKTAYVPALGEYMSQNFGIYIPPTYPRQRVSNRMDASAVLEPVGDVWYSKRDEI